MTRERPLVAVVCSVPLLGEAVAASLDFADVRVFSTRDGDVGGLCRWLRPDAIVVDAQSSADEAAATALPVVHIALRDGVLHLYDGAWDVVEGEGPTPEGIRNVVAGTLFAREERAQ